MSHPEHSHTQATPKRQASSLEAAFFDVDGTLVTTNLVHLYAYYAFNTGSIADIARRAGRLFSSIPAWWVMDKFSRRAFNEAFFRSYKGLSEDRLHVLSEELWDEVLEEAMIPGAVKILENCRSVGAKIVLLTGALDFSVAPLARYLKADEVISNRLEFVRGRATGRVIPPFIEGAGKAHEMRLWAERNGVRLSNSAAYTDSWSDYPMLAIVGHPTVINPDLRLAQAAQTYRWPVVHADPDA